MRCAALRSAALTGLEGIWRYDVAFVMMGDGGKGQGRRPGRGRRINNNAKIRTCSCPQPLADSACRASLYPCSSCTPYADAHAYAHAHARQPAPPLCLLSSILCAHSPCRRRRLSPSLTKARSSSHQKARLRMEGDGGEGGAQ